MKEIKAFKCEFCGKVYQNEGTCKAHEYKCYFNPRTRSCASCLFDKFEEFSDDPGFMHQFVACLRNIDIQTEGLQTRCSLHHDKGGNLDLPLIQDIKKTYNLRLAYESYMKKHNYPRLASN
jgi:hypothetical protein